MNKHLIVLIALLGFGLVGCASPALLRFPVEQYINDAESVELKFACITKKDICIAGLYLDNMQVYEAFGDYSIFKGGINPSNIYKLKIPPAKYKFSASGQHGDIALERFLDISSNSCAIYTADTPDFNYLNLFEKLKPNELVWSLIDCAQFEILTEGLNEIELIEPIYFNKQKQ